MKFLRKLVRRIVVLFDNAIGWVLIAAVLINGAAVFMRYVMRDSISWSEEAIRYLALWITFLGGVTAAWLDEHLDMNLFAETAGARFKAIQKAGLNVLAAIFGIVVTWQGVKFCWLNGLQTAPTTGIRMIWVYAAIPVGGFFLALVSLVKIYDAFNPPAIDETGNKATL
jgi:TRAP-type C4-dicarboxylate transport system permease small subunit